MWARELRKLIDSLKKFCLFVSLLNFSIVMKCLNLQYHQAKTHNYRKRLAYLKNRATTSQNQTLHSQKMKNKQTNKQKKKTLKQIITGDHPTKKKKKKKEEWRTIESTGTRGSNGNK